jgi:hypothetical protein
VTTPELPDTIGALGKELVMRGEMLDAFGDTYDGQLMRLAGAVITQFESMMGQVAHLEAEIRRIERENANRA